MENAPAAIPGSGEIDPDVATLAAVEKRVLKLECALSMILNGMSLHGTFAKYGIEDVVSPGAHATDED